MSALTPEQFLTKLSDNLAHDRSDIADIIDDFLNEGEDKIDDKFSDRYISGKVPGENEIKIEYDTFTGGLFYCKDGDSWSECEDYQTRADEKI